MKSKINAVNHDQSIALDASINLNFEKDICNYQSDDDDDNDDDDFQNDDVATSLNGNGIKERSSPINDDAYHFNSPKNHKDHCQKHNSHFSKIQQKSSINKIENEKFSMAERVFTWVKKYHTMNKVVTDAGSVALGGSGSYKCLKKSVAIPCNDIIDIDIDDNDNNNDNINSSNNDNYNNNNHNYNDDNVDDNNSRIRIDNYNNNTRESRDNKGYLTLPSQFTADNQQIEKTNVLPLFFQHQGHSRTIIGKEMF